MGSSSRSSHSGSRTQSASVAAMTSWAAARIAALRPREMFAPGASSTVIPADASAVRKASTVPSVDPPSTTTTSSGRRACAAREARNSPTAAGPMSFTVVISETFMTGRCYPAGGGDPRLRPGRVPSRMAWSSDTVPAPAGVPRRVATRLLYELKLAASARPALAMPAARLRGHGVLVSSPGVEVLIEGYPRSANSFTVAAFARAQGWPGSGGGRIAHHTHAPAHVLEAIRRGIPAIVLLRDPADAVPEFVLVKPDLCLPQALRGYVRFNEPLVPRRECFL